LIVGIIVQFDTFWPLDITASSPALAQEQENEGASSEPVPVLVVERGIPQTRNFIPIVNHEALIVNKSEEEVTIEIESPVPKDLYLKGEFYPAFMEESLVSEPMSYPHEVEIKDSTLLGPPVIDEKSDPNYVLFRWSNIRIPAKEAVIAQYDNYFGELTRYYKNEGFKIFDLSINTSYDTSLKDGEMSFDLYYDMENQGKKLIEFINFQLFFPYVVTFFEKGSEKDKDVELLKPTEISISPDISPYRGFMSDGFGNPAEGNIFAVSVDKLMPQEHYKFLVKVKGINKVGIGRICPLITSRYRMQADRIWPATNIKSKKILQITNFYYYYVNLVFPDSNFFELGPGSVEVKAAKDVLKPTAPSYGVEDIGKKLPSEPPNR
jgi:hypothetical protein